LENSASVFAAGCPLLTTAKKKIRNAADSSQFTAGTRLIMDHLVMHVFDVVQVDSQSSRTSDDLSGSGKVFWIFIHIL
jgi:hypothetical protein